MSNQITALADQVNAVLPPVAPEPSETEGIVADIAARLARVNAKQLDHPTAQHRAYAPRSWLLDLQWLLDHVAALRSELAERDTALAAQSQELARLREAVVEFVWNLVWHDRWVLFTVDDEAPDYPDEPLAGRVYDDIVKDRLRRRIAALAVTPAEETRRE